MRCFNKLIQIVKQFCQRKHRQTKKKIFVFYFIKIEQFDFVEQMCAAQWSTRGQDLPCPGNDTLSSAGYVTQLDAGFQGLPSNINILLVYTPQSKYETISSKYPAFTVKKGDRFRAARREAGCG